MRQRTVVWLIYHQFECQEEVIFVNFPCARGGGPQVSEVTCGGSPRLTCKRDHIKMRDYMDRRVIPPKRVTSPTWGPPPQALTRENELAYFLFRLMNKSGR